MNKLHRYPTRYQTKAKNCPSRVDACYWLLIHAHHTSTMLEQAMLPIFKVYETGQDPLPNPILKKQIQGQMKKYKNSWVKNGKYLPYLYSAKPFAKGFMRQLQREDENIEYFYEALLRSGI